MKLFRFFGVAVATTTLLCLAACTLLDTYPEGGQSADGVVGASVVGSEAVSKPLVIESVRVAGSVEGISEENKGSWNLVVGSDVKPVIAFYSESEGPLVEVEVSMKLLDGEGGVAHSEKISAENITSEENTHCVTLSSALQQGVWSGTIAAKTEAKKSSAVKFTFVCANSSGNIDIPTTPSVTQRISNFRWNFNGDVRTSDKEKWNPATINKGTWFWFGLDSTEVASYIVFSVAKPGAAPEQFKMSTETHPKFVGLGTNNGFIWARYPKTMDFDGLANFRVDVFFEDGTSEYAEGQVFVGKRTSNVRYAGDSVSIRKGNEKDWNLATLDKGDRFWFGMDTLEVAKSITLTLDHAGKKETTTLTGNDVGFGDKTPGYIWGASPTVLDFVGNCSYTIDVTFAGGVKETYTGSFKVVELVSAPEVSRIRWATTKEGVYELNEYKWNPTLKKDDKVYVGLDTKSAEVKTVKFTISRNGKLEWWYMDLSGNYGGAIDANSIWLHYPNHPTDFSGTLGIYINITYKNGTTQGIGTSAEVRFPGELMKIKTYADTKLPVGYSSAKFGQDYYAFGTWPQTVKNEKVSITNERDYRGYYKGSDGGWYRRLDNVNPSRQGIAFSDGSSIVAGKTYYFKDEPIVWNRYPGTNKLMAVFVLDAHVFYGKDLLRLDFWTNTYQGHVDKNTTVNIGPSNYYYSDIRAWLNGIQNPSLAEANWEWPRIAWAWGNWPSMGWERTTKTGADLDHTGVGFIDWAFTPEQKAMLQAVPLGLNNKEQNVCAQSKNYYGKSTHLLNTTDASDKVFLWSKQEVTKPGIFDNHDSAWDRGRARPASDFALAAGVDINVNISNGPALQFAIAAGLDMNDGRWGEGRDGPAYSAWWWLRSPNWNDNLKSVQVVRMDGWANSESMCYTATNTRMGVVPGIQLPASMLNNAK